MSAAEDTEALAEVLTKALHATETTGGWWGHPECEEFGRLIAPKVAAHVRARVAVVDARLAAVEALFVLDGDYAPCDQATWACPHTECEVAVAVLAALHSDPSEATCSGAGDCPASLHVHGCFADRDGAVCDDPSDHDLVPTSRPDVESPSVGCCTSCHGRGGAGDGPCWDCRGTGCAHPAPTCHQPESPSVERGQP